MAKRRLVVWGGEVGGATLEYVLVSTFAAVVSLVALTFVGKVVKEQLDTMASKLGVDATVDPIDPFGGGS